MISTVSRSRLLQLVKYEKVVNMVKAKPIIMMTIPVTFILFVFIESEFYTATTKALSVLRVTNYFDVM